MRRFTSVCLVILLAFAAVWAATPTPFETVVLPEATYSVGEYIFSPAALPVGYTIGTIRLDKTQWLNPAHKIAYEIQFSMDGGSTWDQVPGCSGQADGGGIDPRTGLPRTFALVACGLGQPDNPDRQAKGKVNVIGGAITTTVTAGFR